MKALKYSPTAREKLRRIKNNVMRSFGEKVADDVMRKIIQSVRDLQHFECKGFSVENMMGIPCDYRMLYTQNNYIFYRIEDDTVLIVDIFNAKEDFMWKLFGIKAVPQDMNED